MKVCGFTFIRNAIIYDYPLVESILSILPICDLVIVAVGRSDDETEQLIRAIDPNKIKIIHTEWDNTLMKGGKVLADETNKAFRAVPKEYDWAVYIQGDEVIHESDHNAIVHAMVKYQDNDRVDGLLFNYRHFYGSYDYIGTAGHWYKQEVRVIKNNPSIFSYRDAQGFRKDDHQKINVIPINAWIYHYGWVKDPEAMQKKQLAMGADFHGDVYSDEARKEERFDYSKEVSSLARFNGSHPSVMNQRIKLKNWNFDYDVTFNKTSLKDRFKLWAAKYLGWEIGFRNFKKIKG